MKTKLTALTLAAATALSLAPKPAVAGDKELAIVGGFLGGLIVASAINDSYHDSYSNRGTAVVYSDRGDRCDDGYWRTVEVRVWIPGCWVVESRHHGRDYRRYVEGHYECRTNRVWVASDRHDRNGRNDRYDRHDREVSSGYGHRR